jgi:hypothetical protein
MNAKPARAVVLSGASLYVNARAFAGGVAAEQRQAEAESAAADAAQAVQ